MDKLAGLRKLEAWLDSGLGIGVSTVVGVASCIWLYVSFFSG